jgi:hypothetical protein
MGLWIKNADGTIERTAGGGADGQPGVDGVDGQPGADGNMWHVGSGAPASTLGEPGDYYLDGTDGWVHVKRSASSWTNLYVNLTGPPGSGGGGDFLPLSGGTVTGDLKVGGTVEVARGVQTSPAIAFGGTSNGFYLTSPANAVATTVNGAYRHIVYDDRTLIKTDLQVDGNTQSWSIKNGNGNLAAPSYSFYNDPSTGLFRQAEGVLGVAGNLLAFGELKIKRDSFNQLEFDRTASDSVEHTVKIGPSYNTVNGKTITLFMVQINGKNLLRVRENETTALMGSLTTTGDLQVDGTIRANKTGSKGNPSINLGATGTGMYAAYLDTDGGKIRTAVNSNIVLEAEHDKVSVLTDLGVAGDLQVDGTITGTLAFGIADGINTRDVLDRAETATMPAFDAEGVATTDVDGLTVNEVVTALLAKVKELSARIETLEGQTCPY